MAGTNKAPEPNRPMRPPATTPEGRENQLIDLAVSLAEKQLVEGTASSQVITHYLKLATTREKFEIEKLKGEIRLNDAKEESLASGKRIEELYKDAMDAMKSYRGEDAEFDVGDY